MNIQDPRTIYLEAATTERNYCFKSGICWTPRKQLLRHLYFERSLGRRVTDGRADEKPVGVIQTKTLGTDSLLGSPLMSLLLKQKTRTTLVWEAHPLLRLNRLPFVCTITRTGAKWTLFGTGIVMSTGCLLPAPSAASPCRTASFAKVAECDGRRRRAERQIVFTPTPLVRRTEASSA